MRRLGAWLVALLLVVGACSTDSSPSDVQDPSEGGSSSVTTLAAEGSAGDGDLFADEAERGDADFSYVIPAGAGEALDAGEPLEILPAWLEVQVGQTIEIVNEDDRGHLVGPFFVGEGETLRQRFSSPGEFIGLCTVHPSGELRLIITET